MSAAKSFGLALSLVPRRPSLLATGRITQSFQLVHQPSWHVNKNALQLAITKSKLRFNSTTAASSSAGPFSETPLTSNPETQDPLTAALEDQNIASPSKDGTEDIALGTAPAPVPEVKDGVLKICRVEIPNIWLRDNCRCSNCMHGETKQRLLDTFKIPRDISIKSAEVEQLQTTVEWSDGHQSVFSNHILQLATEGYRTRALWRQARVKPIHWGAGIKNNPPTTEKPWYFYKSEVLKMLREYGFCFVDGINPSHGKYTERFLQRIAFIRRTHYGGFYDFTADLSSKDTAYTNIALEAHTDNTYFSDPAGLQAFHLLSHTEGEGGESLLVDGFKVAADLKELDPEAYEILSTVNVHAHASGNDRLSIQPYKGFPVLQHDPAVGNLIQVRWNSSDRASIELPINEVTKWYDAARKFDELLKKKENEYWEQLKPGRLLIFDNWRVLHGRSAFTGKRRICGAYIHRDDWIAHFRKLHFKTDDVLERLPIG